jgi:hypothetical protein
MDEYFRALRSNLDAGLQSATTTTLVGALDEAYRSVRANPVGEVFFNRLLLLCHKSMLSAAALIAQAQPEDSVGITRRAVEAAKVVRAIKLNDANAQRWLAYQQRHDRWLMRQAGQKPPSFQVQFRDTAADAVMEDLTHWIGILSDAYVHFTPEFYDSLD